MRKGFTLVELLGTIVILSLIVIVAFPAIISQLKKSNEAVDSSVKQVVTAAAQYMNDNVETYKKALSGKTETYGTKKVTDLVTDGYLEESFIDKHCETKNDTLTLAADEKKYIITYNEIGDDTGC